MIDTPEVGEICAFAISTKICGANAFFFPSLKAARSQVCESGPDLVLIDPYYLRFDFQNEEFCEAREAWNTTRWLAWCGKDPRETSQRARLAGFDGYVSKSEQLPAWMNAIEVVLSGRRFFPDEGGESDAFHAWHS